MRELTPERTTAEWAEVLLELDIPFAEFAALSNIAEQEHLDAVGLFEKIEHPTEGTIVQARPPGRFSASPAGIHRYPPQLGEHTTEILKEAGFSPDEIETFMESQVVAQQNAPD